MVKQVNGNISLTLRCTKMKFFIKGFFSKCGQILDEKLQLEFPSSPYYLLISLLIFKFYSAMESFTEHEHTKATLV